MSNRHVQCGRTDARFETRTLRDLEAVDTVEIVINPLSTYWPELGESAP